MDNSLDSPLPRVRTVPRMIHPHIVVVPRRVRLDAVAIAAAAAVQRRTAVAAAARSVAVHRRHKVVGVVALQRRRRFAVLRLGRLRLHVVVGTIAARRQLNDAK